MSSDSDDNLRKIRQLDQAEIRVLGALLEKEQATPAYYPLTVNALIAACNQKSNRDPVTQLTETEIVEALDALREDVLAWRNDGARVERWSQSISRRLELDPEEKAILTLLMLRGPQTPGELRSRSSRLHAFGNVGEIETALGRLAAKDRALVTELARRPGQKENRWGHQVGEFVEESQSAGGEAPAAPAPVRDAGPSLSQRLSTLEKQVEDLTALVERLGRDQPS